MAIAVWLWGVGLYTIGFNHEGSHDNFIATVPRAVLSAIQMFLSQSDLNDIDLYWKYNLTYMMCFSLCHFCAMFITGLLVFKLLGFRLKNWLRMMLINLFGRWYMRDKECYVFWGINTQSYILAKDVRVSDKDAIIVFVKTLGDADDADQTIGFERILNLVSLKNREIEYLEKINALYVSCKLELSGIDIKNQDRKKPIKVLKKAQLSNVGRLIQKCRQSHVFFLSENENVNIRAALKLVKDEEYLPQASHSVKVYCHARKESRNEAFNGYGRCRDNFNIELVDSSYLSVMILKRKVEYHPVNYLCIDKENAVVQPNSKFTALIIGFGETGQEALNFLYEFGALPKYGAEGFIEKNDFYCCVIDGQMNTMSGTFYAKNPALIDSRELEFVSSNVSSKVYWDKVGELALDLKYVVIALGDDELGMSTAVDLYKYISVKRGNAMSHLSIFVRNHQPENADKMREIARRYNEDNKESGAKIIVFGCYDDVYTKKLIIDEEIKEEALIFKNKYDEVSYDKSNKQVATCNKEETEFIKTINAKRKDAQNESNSMHIATKMALISSDDIKELTNLLDSRRAKTVEYVKANGDRRQRILTNLAIAEHLRWIAAHEIMGYVKGDETNLRKRTHKYMIPWQNLNEETQSFDCNVVDASLLRYSEMSKKREELLSDQI